MTTTLGIQTHKGSEQGSFAANSHLIIGDAEAILVDTQYVRSDAQDVVDMIRRSGKRLQSIFNHAQSPRPSPRFAGDRPCVSRGERVRHRGGGRVH